MSDVLQILNTITEENNSNNDEGDITSLQTATTKPYLPTNEFSVSTENGESSLEDGLVIKDKFNNEYVWIEVPTTIYANTSYNTQTTSEDMKPSSENDVEKIEYCLHQYTSIYRNNTRFSDIWYDRYGTAIDGQTIEGENYGKVTYINTSTKFSTALEYYGTLYTDTELTTTADSFKSGTKYYAKMMDTLLSDTTATGISYSRYNELKEKMLKSIYVNGGFWIGRYEAGIETERTSRGTDAPTTLPQSKENLYPYNCVRCSDAQGLAGSLKTFLGLGASKECSLMFGVQWDLVFKHIETKLVATIPTIAEQLTTAGGTKDMGNYWDSSFTLTRGMYSYKEYTTSPWYDYNEDIDGDEVNGLTTYVENCVKKASSSSSRSVLLTTGASEATNIKNIYDMVGNVSEWTLERGIDPYSSQGDSTARGTSYNNFYGSEKQANTRYATEPTVGSATNGFRLSIF